MDNDELEDVRRRCRTVFLLRAPALWRFGEPLLRAVDDVASFAYRQGRLSGIAEHAHHDDDPGGLAGLWGNNRGLLGHMLTLASSATVATGATVAAGPIAPPLVAWAVAAGAVLILFVRALWPTRRGHD